MTDGELLELVKRVDQQAVRLPPGIKAIAAEIEAAEREACAKVCESEHDASIFGANGYHCANAIRARGDK